MDEATTKNIDDTLAVFDKIYDRLLSDYYGASEGGDTDAIALAGLRQTAAILTASVLK